MTEAAQARGAEALPPLPTPAGPARAVLLPVNPRLLFLFPVIDPPLAARLERASGPAIAIVETSADGRDFREVGRRAFDFRAPGWYLHEEALDAVARVRLGLLEDGRFQEILTSNTTPVPPREPGTGGEARADLLRLRGGAAGPVPRAGPAAAAPPRPVAPAPGPVATSPLSAWSASSPAGRGAWSPPEARRGTSRGTAAEEIGTLCFVLHAHLPFVRHPEREYFQEEHWLFEAATETYLPLLDMFDHLMSDGVPIRVTLSLTPTLMAMFRDPLLMGRYDRYLDRSCQLAAREVARTRRDPDFGPVAGFYRDRLERLRYLFHRVYDRDLVARFGALEEAGAIEIIGCAATHGFLPHLNVVPETARAQIEVGIAEHRRQLGRAPRGLWLPECAWYRGLDRILAEAGIDYVFLDTTALRRASSRPRHDVYAPLFTPAGVAAFGRDEQCSVQVWSSKEGYPGDPAYRDFYRDIGFDLEFDYVAPYLDPAGTRGMTGFKYHRISGPGDHKEPYRRDESLRTADRHAADFVARRRAQAEELGPSLGRGPLIVAMFDAELFGHWWFEGPEWIEGVLRRLRRHGIRLVTGSDELAERPEGQVAQPAASSWGAGGFYEVWLNSRNDWIQPPLEDAGRRMAALAARFAGADDEPTRRALRQAGRELLLAQASDWPFILHGGTTVGYATRRVREHLHRFDLLARQIEAGAVDAASLAALEAADNLFPALDPSVWRPA
jgi:1,4-alpha-glucan branching enzyme